MKKLTIIMLCTLGMYNSSCKKDRPIMKEHIITNPYVQNYTHLQQEDGESLWTNYVLCAGTIAKTHHLDYRVDEDEIQWVESHCHNSNSMETLENYARTYDKNLICHYESMNTNEEQSRVTQMMLDHFDTHHTPFIIAIEENQHLIIWAIDQEEEKVYYSDSRLSPEKSPQQNIKKISLTTLLRWAKNAEYRFIFLWYKV